MKRWIMALVFAASWIAQSSAAGTLRLDFDLSASVPPAGANYAVRGGAASLTLMDVDKTGAPLGPGPVAVLSGFQLDFALFEPNGPFRFNFVQRGSLTLPLNGEVLQIPAGALVGDTSVGSEQPDGTSLPFVTGAFMPTDLLQFSLTRSMGGAFTLRSDGITLSFANRPFSAQVNGRQVARRFVPEPSSIGLCLLALAALVGAHWAPRFRKGAAPAR